ncbi:endonuclease/exonuclease/phosphatase family protein [Kriegella aquimaris]|uniref:Metal-dependent hydrolase, endonuclease/exonuclease/phosphatase family n=1 Tax=Kriegella aquimaris TaxID=192904 RepID=A0A1G9RNE0_9FLAO|nr:endonuclease/exonuclease/phosphatase family protein [Kriegella aquimaris]SDM24806.1 Metal-dependent hydrolase, endonuclease/exonuclease/phosphatase family [Kriegella aquimaris]
MKRKEFITKSTVLATLILVVIAIISCKPKNKHKVDPKRPEASVEIKLAAYNVLFGNWGTPKQIGRMFKPYNLDIICFSEVPDGQWTAKVGEELDMDYTYVGKISSANHKDKFKSILSRTPLYNLHEIEINAVGWGPASMVGAETKIQGEIVLVYSLHIPGRPYFSDTANGSASEFIANQVLPEIKNERFVIMGDFNNHIGDAPLNLLEQNGMQNIWNDLNINVQHRSTHQHIETGVESGVIDHIYYNTKIKAKVYDGGIIMDAKNPKEEDKSMPSYKVEWEKYGKPLSDHRPIWAAIKW